MRDPIYSPHTPISYADYLAADEASSKKHEFCGGAIRAMAGGTPTHSKLGTNALGELYSALRGRSCQPRNSDQRVRVDETGEAFYPDALVVCAPDEYSSFDRNALVNPTLILEVMSPSTREFDRTAKFASYSLIPSLRDVLFIESNFVRIEHYHRENAQTEWFYRAFYRRADSFSIESLQISLSLEAIYLGVDVPDALLAFAELRSE